MRESGGRVLATPLRPTINPCIHPASPPLGGEKDDSLGEKRGKRRRDEEGVWEKEKRWGWKKEKKSGKGKKGGVDPTSEFPTDFDDAEDPTAMDVEEPSKKGKKKGKKGKKG